MFSMITTSKDYIIAKVKMIMSRPFLSRLLLLLPSARLAVDGPMLLLAFHGTIRGVPTAMVNCLGLALPALKRKIA